MSTALVAAAAGLAVAWWRRTTRSSFDRSVVSGAGSGTVSGRLGPLLLVLVSWWLVVVDHFGANAFLQLSKWADPGAGPEATAPAVLRWSWQLTGRGGGRLGLLVVLLVAAVVVDARRLNRAPSATRSGSTSAPNDGRAWLTADLAPGWLRRTAAPQTSPPWLAGLVDGLRDVAVVVVGDLRFVLLAHTRQPGQSRTQAAREGLAGAVLLRRSRAQAFADDLRTTGRGVGAARRQVRAVAVTSLVLALVVSVVVAPWLAERIGASLTRHVDTAASASPTGDGWWLAGYVDSLASWWHGLSPGAQLGVLVAVGALAGLATGGLGTAFFVSGIAGYGLAHGHGLATLLRDPKAGVRAYLSSLTPQGALLDAGEVLLTFVPTGTGALLKRPNTWPEILADWKAGSSSTRRSGTASRRTRSRWRTASGWTRTRTASSSCRARTASWLTSMRPPCVSTCMSSRRSTRRGRSSRTPPRQAPSFPQLIGQPLRGRPVLEVPVQNVPVPRAVLRAARQARVEIRDITGHRGQSLTSRWS